MKRQREYANKMKYHKKFHLKVLFVYVISIYFGAFFISSVLYSQYQNIIIMDCNANDVFISAYKWTRDRLNGPIVGQDYFKRIVIPKFQQMLYQAGPVLKNDITWINSQLDIVSTKADVSPKDSLFLVNFAFAEYLSPGMKNNFWPKVNELKAIFNQKFQNTVFTVINRTLEGVASYMALNSRFFEEKTEQIYQNALLDFNPESFTLTYSMNSSSNLTVPFYKGSYMNYDYDSRPLEMFVSPNQCSGFLAFFIRMHARESSRSSVVRASCLAQNFNLTVKDLSPFDFENSCQPNYKRPYFFTGIGHELNCEQNIDFFISLIRCGKKNLNEFCLDIPEKALPSDLKLFVSNGPYYLLEDLRKWRSFGPQVPGFEKKYLDARNFLCENDLNDRNLTMDLRGLDNQKLVLYCWKMMFYERILRMYGYPLKKWKYIEFIEQPEGLTKGIAMMEANAESERIVLKLFVNMGSIYISFFFLLLPIYLVGMSLIYTEFPRIFKTRHVFTQFYAFPREYAYYLGRKRPRRKKTI